MDLRRFLMQYLSGQTTGQLVIKFEGERHLCKISVENGHAVYISLGTRSPEETIGHIRGKVAVEANFIEGIAPARKLGAPLDDALLALPAVSVQAPPLPPAGDGESLLPADTVTAMVDHFIDIVGPLGAVLADEHMVRVGYASGSAISAGAFALLLAGLAEEVPEDKRAEFKGAHA